ncbi:MAG TPA: MFS transporter [Acidimicrobiales bacterium]|nr:MFS transporter [Acidimicrobiales bacterium]
MTRRVVAVGRRTFSALSIPNYRRYYGGQSISLVGTWMQSVALTWLVYVVTHSSTDLGLTVGAQTLPVLLLGPYGGVIADRVDKRRLMVVLQSAMGVQALILGVLTVTGAITYWEIVVLSVILGLNNTFENPARQTFIQEMVGPDELRNAVSLNSTLFNAARAVGPAVAGILIATVGVGVCFLINAGSFVAVVFSLTTMDKSKLQPTVPVARAKGQLREGFRYVASDPRLLTLLIMMGIVGTLAYEFQVILPVVAKKTFHGGPETYGFLTAAMGAGAVFGGLITATRGRTGLRRVSVAAAVFGLTIVLAAGAPILAIEIGVLAAVGWASVSFLATGNTTLQLEADPSMRGRVMALWAVAMLGSTPIGGPLMGWVASVGGGRVALAVGGVSCFVASGIGLTVLWRLKRRSNVDVEARSVDVKGAVPDGVLLTTDD